MKSRRVRWWWAGALVLTIPLLLLMDRQRTGRPLRAEWLPAGSAHVRALRLGSGDTTLLFLHGYGESLLAFRNVIPGLAARYGILAVDLPGSGLSESPDNYSLDSTVSRVSSLLDSVTQGPIVAVGHSMGGEVAAALALARPDRIVGLVLIAPAGFALNFGLGGEPFSQTQQQLAAWSVKAREVLVPVEDPDWLDDPYEMPESVKADSISRRAAAGILRDFDFTAMRDRFRGIRQSTLIIWGGLDPLIPLSVGREIAGAIPNARLVVLGNSWHRPHVEQPSRVVREIRRFLTHRDRSR